MRSVTNSGIVVSGYNTGELDIPPGISWTGPLEEENSFVLTMLPGPR